MSPALAGRFFTTEPLGKPSELFFKCTLQLRTFTVSKKKKKNSQCRAAITTTHFQIAFMVPSETLHPFNTLILPLQPLVTCI